MSKIGDILQYLEEIAPPALQESYDNAGLITGNRDTELEGVIISLDCTEEIIEEAIDKGCNLIIAHHPIIFKGLKSLTGANYVERTILKAIKNDIAIYAIHTNLDNVMIGVNKKLASIIGLNELEILQPSNGNLMKVVTFVPQSSTATVLEALHRAGAGAVGEYSSCSFSVTGTGRFTASKNANPQIGNTESNEEVIEDRVEIILPKHLENKIIQVLKKAHPYEEPAYYLNDLNNVNENIGAGMVGQLANELSVDEFLKHLKSCLQLEVIKYTKSTKSIKRVAICGGSGSFLLKAAMRSGADAFITGDVKYHDFFDAENEILFCDIGHYESEVATKDLLYELLTKKFTNFALHLSECVTNPIKYYK